MSRHAVSFLELKALDADQRIIEGWASRPEVDRVGDIVESKGAQYRLPLPLLLDHVHSSAVGEVFAATVSDAGIRFKAKIAQIAEPGTLKDLCDTAWQAAKAGLRKAVSIGFRPLEAEPNSNGGMRFKRWEWYELSMVTVPCLATATIDQVKAFDRDLRNKRAPVRVVRLDTPIPGSRKALPVVRLGATNSDNSMTLPGRPVCDAMLKAVEAEQRFLEELKDRKSLGANNLHSSMIAAGAKATDEALAALQARLDRLERGK